MFSNITTTGIMVITVLALFSIIGCGKSSEEKAAEEMTKMIIKRSTGRNVDVKMQEGTIKIQGEGSRTEISKTNTWPSDMFPEVPPFTAAKVENVVKTDEDRGMKKFNIYLKDIQGNGINTYSDLLKQNGWRTSTMQAGGKGGMINAQKGNINLTLAYSLEKMNGTLMVYTTPGK